MTGFSTLHGFPTKIQKNTARCFGRCFCFLKLRLSRQTPFVPIPCRRYRQRQQQLEPPRRIPRRRHHQRPALLRHNPAHRKPIQKRPPARHQTARQHRPQTPSPARFPQQKRQHRPHPAKRGNQQNVFRRRPRPAGKKIGQNHPHRRQHRHNHFFGFAQHQPNPYRPCAYERNGNIPEKRRLCYDWGKRKRCTAHTAAANKPHRHPFPYADATRATPHVFLFHISVFPICLNAQDGTCRKGTR